jgi:uncharacterized membrane protein
MDNMHYRLTLQFDISIAKWRIDDPRVAENAEWSLSVYDRNKGEWVNIRDLNRPGEFAHISRISLMNDETPGRTPEDPTDDVSS